MIHHVNFLILCIITTFDDVRYTLIYTLIHKTVPLLILW